MSIVESRNPRRVRISGLEGLAGGALVAAAVFAACPSSVRANPAYLGWQSLSGGTSTNPNSANAESWFNISNWGFVVTNITDNTGTLPESYASGQSGATVDEVNTTAMPSVGVVFDPADDANVPAGTTGGNSQYMANVWASSGSLIVGSFIGTAAQTPAKLTIESGTIYAQAISIGRDSAAEIVQNGGVLAALGSAMKVQSFNKITTLGTGTYEYHGGTLEAFGIQVVAGGCSIGPTQSLAAVGSFIVYNDGPDGAVLSANGFQFDQNNYGYEDIGTVEFHYDLNSGGIGNVRPVQDNWNDTALANGNAGTGKLQILQGTVTTKGKGTASLPYTLYSSRLNLVLDTAPSVISGLTQNLGLFDQSIITGSGTFPKAFYSADGSTIFTQGATISAVYSGTIYSWTISYSGQINFTSTAVSGYNSSNITATGGNDVVLIGLAPQAVPEPTSMALLGGAGSLILARRRQKKEHA